MNTNFPTRFQKKTLWSAITMLSVIAIGAMAVGLIWLFTIVMGFLQPVLVPLAVAGVLTYLLYPLVDKLIDRGVHQKKASLIVYISFIAASSILIISIAVPVSKQAGILIKEFPAMSKKFEETLDGRITAFKTTYADDAVLGGLAAWLPAPAPIDAESPPTPAVNTPTTTGPTTTGPATPPTTGAPLTPPGSETAPDAFAPNNVRSWVLKQLPVLGENLWLFVRKSVGGFLGAFGFVIGIFLVPIYLFFFLREAPNIRSTWSDYLPLKASKFKDEVVATLTEVNGYLVAFFRGQMLVSLIDGTITAILLSIIGLKFGLLIGVLVGLLGVIPYVGILLCYIPAIIIATVQGAQHDWYMSQDAAWWVLPLVVTIVFIAVNNLDGILIAPKIVGDSVGLHAFTVIFSVLFWSSLLGGLLGAILAVPLTASIKVLFHRYVWSRRIAPKVREKPEPEPA